MFKLGFKVCLNGLGLDSCFLSTWPHMRLGRVDKGYRLRRALYSVLRSVNSMPGILKDGRGNGYLMLS